MIPSVAADFHAASDAILDSNYGADALRTTHVLIEIGQAWLDGVADDHDMALRLRNIAGPMNRPQP